MEGFIAMVDIICKELNYAKKIHSPTERNFQIHRVSSYLSYFFPQGCLQLFAGFAIDFVGKPPIGKC